MFGNFVFLKLLQSPQSFYFFNLAFKMASFKIEQKEEKSDITNVENYKIEITYVDEIVKKAFKSMFKDSLELAGSC